MGARIEGAAEWIRLFLRLLQICLWYLSEDLRRNVRGIPCSKGLDEVYLVVGDDVLDLPDAIEKVFGDTPLQICLWYLSEDLRRNVRGIPYIQKKRMINDFWEVFNAFNVEDSYERYAAFLRR